MPPKYFISIERRPSVARFQISVAEQGAEAAVEVEIAGKAEAPFTVEVARGPPRGDDGEREAVAVTVTESCRVSRLSPSTLPYKYRVRLKGGP